MVVMKNHVRLSAEERKILLVLVQDGIAPAKDLMHAHVLLVADENSEGESKSENEIAKLCHVTKLTVHNIRKRYAENGLTAAFWRKRKVKVSPETA